MVSQMEVGLYSCTILNEMLYMDSYRCVTPQDWCYIPILIYRCLTFQEPDNDLNSPPQLVHLGWTHLALGMLVCYVVTYTQDASRPR